MSMTMMMKMMLMLMHCAKDRRWRRAHGFVSAWRRRPRMNDAVAISENTAG
jgi:hypothetical protein